MLIEKITQLLEEKIREELLNSNEYLQPPTIEEEIESRLNLMAERIVTCFGGRE